MPRPDASSEFSASLLALAGDVSTTRLFDNSNMFMFVEPWSGQRARRLYLRGEDGETLGYKDLGTGGIAVLDAGDAAVVRALLNRAGAGPLDLNPGDLPKVAMAGAGGGLLSRVGGGWTNFFIAQSWRRGSQHRLYVTHAMGSGPVYKLGHIDLAAATLHPVAEQPLARDLSSPERYLRVTLSRYLEARSKV